jgi:hypothetical protein
MNTLQGIQICIRGIGAAPSFKTGKRTAINKVTGKPFPYVQKKHKHWMKQAVDLIESGLNSYSATGAEKTSMGLQQQSLIASLLPADDCWTVIQELVVTGKLCSKGDEGVTIKIERL